MTMNGKSGAIYAFLYNLISLFGKENEEGILIDMQVTNDDIAGFCGISTKKQRQPYFAWIKRRECNSYS